MSAYTDRQDRPTQARRDAIDPVHVSGDLDAALDAMGDPTRRRILGCLATSAMDVGGLAAVMPVGRTAVSMHLRVLKDAGLVWDEPVGNRRVYRVEPDMLRRVRDHMDWYWERSLAAYRDHVEGRSGEVAVASEPEVLVAKSIQISAPVAAAFDAFIGMAWWPVESHHISGVPGSTAFLEPFQGGRWYERSPDGVETIWGSVLIWQPPQRLLLSWLVNPQWEYEPDPLRASEIEVTFTSEGPTTTRVDLVHRRLERYGSEAERMRKILDNKGAEPLIYLRRFIESHPRH